MVAVQRIPGGAPGQAITTGQGHSGMPAVLSQGPDTATIGRSPHNGDFARLLEAASLPSAHRMQANAMVAPAITTQPLSAQAVNLRPIAAQSVSTVQDSVQRALSVAFGRSAASSADTSIRSVVMPDSNKGGRIGRIVFLVMAAVIATEVLKSMLGLAFEDALPLLVLVAITFFVWRKRRAPPSQ